MPLFYFSHQSLRHDVIHQRRSKGSACCYHTRVIVHSRVHRINPLAQVKWERLLCVLRGVSASAVQTADRVALLVVQRLGPVATAIFKTVVTLAPDGQQQQLLCPSEDELIAQVCSIHPTPAQVKECYRC